MDTRTNDDWISAFAASLSRRFPDRATTKHDVNDLQIFVRAQPKPLTSVTRAAIDAFVDGERARDGAPATVKRRTATLVTFFAFLAEELDEPQRPNSVNMRRHAGRQPQLLPRDRADQDDGGRTGVSVSSVSAAGAGCSGLWVVITTILSYRPAYNGFLGAWCPKVV